MSLRMLVVYDHPLDYPNYVVARFWDASPEGVRSGHGMVALFHSLELARRWIAKHHPELVRIERDPEDDPKIVETWL